MTQRRRRESTASPLPASAPVRPRNARGCGARTPTPGDIITAANGVTARTPFDLAKALERVGIGGTIDLTVRRDGETATMGVKVVDVDQPPRR
jgi:2-alkenal reductase